MSNLLMNRKEVAEYLGVTPQTVSNWINRGLLKTIQDEGRAIYVRRECVEKFADRLKMTDEDEQKLIKYMNQTREERKYWENLWDDTNTAQITRQQLLSYVDIIQLGVMRAFELDDCVLSQREKDIIRMALSLKPISDIAHEFGITKKMVGSLFRKVLVKLRKLQSVRPYMDIVKENSMLREQVNMANNRNDELKSLIIASIQGIECQHDETSGNKLEILATRIDQLPLSVRTKNVLLRIGNTLGDAIQYRREDIRRMRHMGIKSILELDEFIDKNGLKYGTKAFDYEQRH